MNFNIKKEKRYQYFAPDNASTIPFSIALNNHITYLNKKFEDLVLLCIGTDKITGDCLGPLVGSKLKQREISLSFVWNFRKTSPCRQSDRTAP